MFRSKVKKAIKGDWYKKNDVKSSFINKVEFEGKLLPGAAQSAFGEPYQLKDVKSGNKFKYVLKAVGIEDMNDFIMFQNEVNTGLEKSALKWGTRIFTYTFYDFIQKKTLDSQSARQIMQQGIPNRKLTGIYIMQHVLKGRQPSKNIKFKTLADFKYLFGKIPHIRNQLVIRLQYLLKEFYKQPKLHGDLHFNNILVVYSIDKNIKDIKIKDIKIIDYGATYTFNDQEQKMFKGKNSLRNIGEKQRSIIKGNPAKFIDSGRVWPEQSRVSLYEKQFGGQDLRLNHNLLTYLNKSLMYEVYTLNEHKKPGESYNFTNSVKTAYGTNSPNQSHKDDSKTPPKQRSLKNKGVYKAASGNSKLPPGCKCACKQGLVQGKRGGWGYKDAKGQIKYCSKKYGVKTKTCAKYCPTPQKVTTPPQKAPTPPPTPKPEPKTSTPVAFPLGCKCACKQGLQKGKRGGWMYEDHRKNLKYCGQRYGVKTKACAKYCPTPVQKVKTPVQKVKTPAKAAPTPVAFPPSCKCACKQGLQKGKRGGWMYEDHRKNLKYCGNKYGVKTKACAKYCPTPVQKVKTPVQKVKTPVQKVKTPAKAAPTPVAFPHSCKCACKQDLVQGKRGGWGYVEANGNIKYCGQKYGKKTKKCSRYCGSPSKK